MPSNDSDYKQIFTQLIKKQMLILGPDITLAKVKNVPGLTVEATGEVINIQGDPQVLLQNLINQFVELSGMIVKKTMESILTSYPNLARFGVAEVAAVVPPVQPAQASPVESASIPAQPVAPITMPTVEEAHTAPTAPVNPQVVAPQPQPEVTVPTQPSTPVQTQEHVQQPTAPTPQAQPQTVASQNPAALDDLSSEEVEKLNKMIQEMNQMPPENGEEASKK